MIQHIWFDFSETIAALEKDYHDRLLYASFAHVVGEPVTPALIERYQQLRKIHKSNSAVFTSLGRPSHYWSDCVNAVDPRQLYKLMSPRVPAVLQQLRDIVPISLFSNMHIENILSSLGIDPTWFANILFGGIFQQPKPALEGFYHIVELSKLPADSILYIGDDVEKDILPAQAVGMKTGIVWSTSPKADYSFLRFEEILQLVIV